MPTISVVIPNLNDSATLVKCLKSVIDQSVKFDQIIFVDDCSSDNSLSIAHELLSNISGVTILANESTLGTVSTLNIGLKKIITDYVLFLSSNDYILDTFVERAKSSISKYGTVGVWSAMVNILDKNGFEKNHSSPIIGLKESIFTPEKCIEFATKLGNWFTGTTLLFNRELLQNIGGLEDDYGGLSDLFAALTLSSLYGSIFCPETLGVQRQHSKGYLWRTLIDKNKVIHIINEFEKRGGQLSPNLHTKKFINRTRERIYFSSTRAMLTVNNNEYLIYFSGVKYRALKIINHLNMDNFRIRIFIIYLIIRPYDIFFAIWYRVFLVMIKKISNSFHLSGLQKHSYNS